MAWTLLARLSALRAKYDRLCLRASRRTRLVDDCYLYVTTRETSNSHIFHSLIDRYRLSKLGKEGPLACVSEDNHVSNNPPSRTILKVHVGSTLEQKSLHRGLDAQLCCLFTTLMRNGSAVFIQGGLVGRPPARGVGYKGLVSGMVTIPIAELLGRWFALWLPEFWFRLKNIVYMIPGENGTLIVILC